MPCGAHVTFAVSVVHVDVFFNSLWFQAVAWSGASAMPFISLWACLSKVGHAGIGFFGSHWFLHGVCCN